MALQIYGTNHVQMKKRGLHIYAKLNVKYVRSTLKSTQNMFGK